MTDLLHLRASPETCCYGAFDAAIPPVLEARSGDRLQVACVSGGVSELPGASEGFDILPDHAAVLEALRPDPGPHILTGPVAVAGAEPGDALEVRIDAVRLRQNWGWTVIRPGRGALPEDFPDTRLWRMPIDAGRGVARLPWGQPIALRPFFGIIGVAPRPELGRLSSIPPAAHGGNMDLKELTAGSRLFLPVWADGARLSFGDGHAVQGDGEVCLTALETALEGEVQMFVWKRAGLDLPVAETPSHLITLGFDPDLDEAARIALRAMIAQIRLRTGRSAEEAYMLCSLAADLRVTQVVDGNKGAHVMLGREWLGAGWSRPEGPLAAGARRL